MRRSCRKSIALAAVAVVALTGCSPGVIGFAGIQRTDHGFRAVVAMCDEGYLSDVELRDRSQVNDKHEYLVVELWPIEETENRIAIVEIPDDSVFPLKLGHGQYMLWGTVQGLFPSVVSGPKFDAADVEGLHEGEILTAAPHKTTNVTYPDTHAMEAAVDAYCGPK